MPGQPERKQARGILSRLPVAGGAGRACWEQNAQSNHPVRATLSNFDHCGGAPKKLRATKP